MRLRRQLPVARTTIEMFLIEFTEFNQNLFYIIYKVDVRITVISCSCMLSFAILICYEISMQGFKFEMRMWYAIYFINNVTHIFLYRRVPNISK